MGSDGHKVVITLEEPDLLELQAILLDSDQAAALEFLRHCVASRIPAKGKAACDSSRLNPYLWKTKSSR